MIIPTKTQIRAIRILAKQTQKAAAESIGLKQRHWEYIEAGTKKISEQSWELYLMKTGLKEKFEEMISDV